MEPHQPERHKKSTKTKRLHETAHSKSDSLAGGEQEAKQSSTNVSISLRSKKNNKKKRLHPIVSGKETTEASIEPLLVAEMKIAEPGPSKKHGHQLATVQYVSSSERSKQHSATSDETYRSKPHSADKHKESTSRHKSKLSPQRSKTHLATSRDDEMITEDMVIQVPSRKHGRRASPTPKAKASGLLGHLSATTLESSKLKKHKKRKPHLLPSEEEIKHGTSDKPLVISLDDGFVLDQSEVSLRVSDIEHGSSSHSEYGNIENKFKSGTRPYVSESVVQPAGTVGEVTIEPSEIKLQVSHIEDDYDSNELSELRLSVSPTDSKSNSKEPSDIRLEISHIDNLDTNKEELQSEDHIQVSPVDVGTSALGHSKHLSLLGACKKKPAHHAKGGVSQQEGQGPLGVKLSTASSPVGGRVHTLSSLQKPKLVHRTRYSTANIPPLEEETDSYHESSIGDASYKFTTSEELSHSQMVDRLSVQDRTTVSATTSGAVRRVSKSFDLPIRKGSATGLPHDHLYLPSTKDVPGSSSKVVETVSETKQDFLKPNVQHWPFIKSESTLGSTSFYDGSSIDSGQDNLDTSSLPSHDFSIPTRSYTRLNTRLNTKVSRIAQILEKKYDIPHKDTVVSFGTVETLEYSSDSEYTVSPLDTSSMSQDNVGTSSMSQDNRHRLDHAQELEKIRASARRWVAKSKLPGPNLSVQKRPLIEIPRALRLQIWKEAYTVVEKMSELYRSTLGPNDTLTQGAADHILANSDKFQATT